MQILVHVDYRIACRRSTKVARPEWLAPPTRSIAAIRRSIRCNVLVDTIAVSKPGHGAICRSGNKVAKDSTFPRVGLLGIEVRSMVSCDTSWDLCWYVPTSKRYHRNKIWMGEKKKMYPNEHNILQNEELKAGQFQKVSPIFQSTI